MLWKCGEILKEKGLLEIPTIEDLKTEKGQEEYLKCDDRWLLNKIYDEKNPPEVKVIADMIKKRRSFHETYSPSTYRQPTPSKQGRPDNSVSVLEPIQTALNKNLKDLGIEDHEFLTDITERSPYSFQDLKGREFAAKKRFRKVSIF